MVLTENKIHFRELDKVSSVALELRIEGHSFKIGTLNKSLISKQSYEILRAKSFKAAQRLQGTLKAFQLQPYAYPNARAFISSTAVTLAASTVLLNHIADENEAHGLGSGLTMMIALPMLLSALCCMPMKV